MELTTAILGRLKPVGGLSTHRLEELLGMCRVQHFKLGCDPLLGRTGLEFVYLISGELKIVLPDGGVCLLVGGCDIANWPIGYKTVLPVSSKAVTDVVLLRIEFDVLDIVMTWDEMINPVEPAEPASAGEALPSGAFSAQVLTGPALAQLPPAHIHELLNRLERIDLRAGQAVVLEGSPGDAYFLIESGRCEVRKKIGGVDLCVAELKPGDAFGEESLVAEVPRNASVLMKTDGVVLRLSKPDFVELVRAPLLHTVDRGQADRRVADGQARWLDVRYPAEFSEDGLPGAINIPLNEIRSAFGVLDRQREYIVYCQSGRRSSAAAFLLAQNGFRASMLEGGLGMPELS